MKSVSSVSSSIAKLGLPDGFWAGVGRRVGSKKFNLQSVWIFRKQTCLSQANNTQKVLLIKKDFIWTSLGV